MDYRLEVSIRRRFPFRLDLTLAAVNVESRVGFSMICFVDCVSSTWSKRPPAYNLGGGDDRHLLRPIDP